MRPDTQNASILPGDAPISPRDALRCVEIRRNAPISPRSRPETPRDAPRCSDLAPISAQDAPRRLKTPIDVSARTKAITRALMRSRPISLNFASRCSETLRNAPRLKYRAFDALPPVPPLLPCPEPEILERSTCLVVWPTIFFSFV